MRTFLLLFFLIVFSQFGRSQNATVFITSTDASAFGVCDGTLTYWVEGASVTDTFVFVLNGVPQPQVNDTIFAQSGVCEGTYTVTLALDTLSALNYTCCNCIGVLCGGGTGGSAGSGASATVGSPPPELEAILTLTSDECLLNGSSAYTLDIMGQAPPYQVNVVNYGTNGWVQQGNEDYGLWNCEILFFQPDYFETEVMDATGQIVNASVVFPNLPVCEGALSVSINATNMTVCSGDVIPGFWFGSNENLGVSGGPFSNSSYYVTDYSLNQIGSNYTFFSGYYGNEINEFVPPFVAVNNTNSPITVNFSVDAYNSCGSASEFISITVYPEPNLSAGLDQTVCEGESITLAGSGTSAYSWNNGVVDGVPFSPSLGSTTYTLVGTSSQGCSGSD